MRDGSDQRRALFAYAPHADTFGYSMPPPGLLRLGGALELANRELEIRKVDERIAPSETNVFDK